MCRRRALLAALLLASCSAPPLTGWEPKLRDQLTDVAGRFEATPERVHGLAVASTDAALAAGDELLFGVLLEDGATQQIRYLRLHVLALERGHGLGGRRQTAFERRVRPQPEKARQIREQQAAAWNAMHSQPREASLSLRCARIRVDALHADGRMTHGAETTVVLAALEDMYDACLAGYRQRERMGGRVQLGDDADMLELDDEDYDDVVRVAAGVGSCELLFRLLQSNSVTLSHAVGVEFGKAADPRRMIADTVFFDLLEALVRDDPMRRDVAVKLGASMRCEDYGAFGLAFKSAVDLAGSYQRVERFGRIVTSIANFRVVDGAATSCMEVIPAPGDRLGLQMTHELALAAAAALSREVCASFAIASVRIAHAGGGDTRTFEELFGCPVQFGRPHDALEISNDVLRHRNRQGDAGFSRFFDDHLDRALADLPQEGRLERMVRAEIAQALSEGVPTLSQMARRLQMGGRTLQRRLAEERLSYQDLLENVRRELALRLLRGSDYALVEVAFLTGFSDQSTFSRAFKRWSGQTPRAYRLAQRD